jgi:hypothetical protein
MPVGNEREPKKRSDTNRADKKNSDEHGGLPSTMHGSVSRKKPSIVAIFDKTPFNNREFSFGLRRLKRRGRRARGSRHGHCSRLPPSI